jgi:hypothetical protein
MRIKSLRLNRKSVFIEGVSTSAPQVINEKVFPGIVMTRDASGYIDCAYKGVAFSIGPTLVESVVYDSSSLE